MHFELLIINVWHNFMTKIGDGLTKDVMAGVNSLLFAVCVFFRDQIITSFTIFMKVVESAKKQTENLA